MVAFVLLWHFNYIEVLVQQQQLLQICLSYFLEQQKMTLLVFTRIGEWHKLKDKCWNRQQRPTAEAWVQICLTLHVSNKGLKKRGGTKTGGTGAKTVWLQSSPLTLNSALSQIQDIVGNWVELYTYYNCLCWWIGSSYHHLITSMSFLETKSFPMPWSNL